MKAAYQISKNAFLNIKKNVWTFFWGVFRIQLIASQKKKMPTRIFKTFAAGLRHDRGDPSMCNTPVAPDGIPPFLLSLKGVKERRLHFV